MSFDIGWISQDESQSGTPRDSALGIIRIAAFTERFIASLTFWSKEEYERQWRSALVLLMSGSTKTALISSMRSPLSLGIVHWWPLYRCGGDRVAVQNQLLFLDQLREPLDLSRISHFVPNREVLDDEGNAISEWETTIGEIEECAARFLPAI